MKISQIIQETSTTAGSVAPVEHGFVKMQTRNPGVYGGNKVGNLLKGKKTNKAFANSVNESAEISETELSEQDLIVVPGQGRSRKNGFVPHGQSRVDHEVEMARSDLIQASKNAEKVYNMIEEVGEDEGLDGWVQEKIIKANDYLNTVREYLEGKEVQGMNEGEDGVDSLVTDTETVMRKFKMDATQALQALKIVLGEREYKDRPGFYNSFIRQIIARSKQQGVAEGSASGRFQMYGVRWNSKKRVSFGSFPTLDAAMVKADDLDTAGFDSMDPREDHDELHLLDTQTGQQFIHTDDGVNQEWEPIRGKKGVAEGEGNKYGSQENWDSLRKDIRSQYPYKKGTNVTVPHKGKLVNGKIVRYEAGKGGYSPTYVVDIGEYESIMVPPNKVRRDTTESLGTTGAMTNGEMGESQLDELSPKALGNYVKSAAGDMANRKGNTQFQKGARVATSAFTSKQSPGRFEKDDKIEKRQDGINRAVNKITGKN